MEPKAKVYLPQAFRVFQGFRVIDLQDFRLRQHLEIVLERESTEPGLCHRCGTRLGALHDRYQLRARHLRIMGWTVSVLFWREKRHCPECKKVRCERIEFLCPTSPHVTMDLAWWLNRLSEVTSVLSVSRLERVDKKACYEIDKHILRRLLQGYRIPKVTRISVDEVYARSPRQMKEDEDRDDLFLTVVVDLNTRKVIWVSQSRKKEALDEFFELLGSEACKKIEVVATDQHRGYAASVAQYCPRATLVWDRFHIVQQFNEALNEDRKEALEAMDPEGRAAEEIGDLMHGKYRYVYLTKAKNRTTREQRQIEYVLARNEKMAKLELIKEHFHKVFDCQDVGDAQTMLEECWTWSQQARAWNVHKWLDTLMDGEPFWNYFKYRVTTGLSEGINRIIKGIKWQAYGYKDMFYFALKILQKAGYLNSRYHFQKIPDPA